MGIEFAILAAPFFATILAIVSVGYHSLMQAELDRATTAISANLGMYSNTMPTPADYISTSGCAKYVGVLLNCKKVNLSATKVDGRLFDYRNLVMNGSQWKLGCAGDTVLVELTYPFSEILSPMVVADIVTKDGKKYYRSRAVIRREPVISGAGAC